MCARFSLGTSAEKLAELFELAQVPDWTSRYYVVFTPPALCVVESSTHSGRQYELRRWGLISSWAMDPSRGGSPSIPASSVFLRGNDRPPISTRLSSLASDTLIGSSRCQTKVERRVEQPDPEQQAVLEKALQLFPSLRAGDLLHIAPNPVTFSEWAAVP